MQRLYLICLAGVLLLTDTVSADLIVYDYLENGEEVVLDTETGYHWYRNLADLQDMTYGEQMLAVEYLNHNDFGNIAGGWHFATRQELRTLWNYLAPEIGEAFVPSLVDSSSYYWSGRYRRFVSQTPAHYHAHVSCSLPGPVWQKTGLMDSFVYNDAHGGIVGGAWVTTDAPIIPVPSAILLGGIGISFSGWLLRRRTSRV